MNTKINKLKETRVSLNEDSIVKLNWLQEEGIMNLDTIYYDDSTFYQIRVEDQVVEYEEEEFDFDINEAINNKSTDGWTMKIFEESIKIAQQNS